MTTKEVRVALPTQYANMFKARCATKGTSMSAVIKDGIAAWMRENSDEKRGGVV